MHTTPIWIAAYRGHGEVERFIAIIIFCPGSVLGDAELVLESSRRERSTGAWHMPGAMFSEHADGERRGACADSGDTTSKVPCFLRDVPGWRARDPLWPLGVRRSACSEVLKRDPAGPCQSGLDESDPTMHGTCHGCVCTCLNILFHAQQVSARRGHAARLKTKTEQRRIQTLTAATATTNYRDDWRSDRSHLYRYAVTTSGTLTEMTLTRAGGVSF